MPLSPEGVIQIVEHTEFQTADLRGDTDKSLARPTSRCRWTESIVSLERVVCLKGKRAREGH